MVEAEEELGVLKVLAHLEVTEHATVVVVVVVRLAEPLELRLLGTLEAREVAVRAVAAVVWLATLAQMVLMAVEEEGRLTVLVPPTRMVVRAVTVLKTGHRIQ